MTRPLTKGARRSERGSAGQPGDFDAEVFAQLYSKLAATFSASQTVGARTESLLSPMIPGLYIKENLDPNDPYTQYLVSNLLNMTLACSWVVNPGAATVTDVYQAILNGKETPLTHLTGKQREELDAARALVFQPDGEPTELYARYLDLNLCYLSALDAFEQALATEYNGGPPVPAAVRVALEEAATRWREDGHEYEVDLAFATIDQYDALDPALFWYRLAGRFEAWTRYYGDGSRYQHITSLPPYHEWFTDYGWTYFTFDEKDFTNQTRSGGTGLEASCCCPCSTPQRDQPARTGTPTRFRLTCEVRRVEIIRPWLDPLVLHSTAWRWSPASAAYGTQISTGGDLPGSVIPTGAMPVLPTTALLTRRLYLSWEDGASPVADGPERRFGPFGLAGADIGEHHISMPDPQLIGFLSEVLPRCPNPDARLPWPDSDSSPFEGMIQTR